MITSVNLRPATLKRVMGIIQKESLKSVLLATLLAHPDDPQQLIRPLLSKVINNDSMIQIPQGTKAFEPSFEPPPKIALPKSHFPVVRRCGLHSLICHFNSFVKIVDVPSSQIPLPKPLSIVGQFAGFRIPRPRDSFTGEPNCLIEGLCIAISFDCPVCFRESLAKRPDQDG
jgi:hypothetical protein